MAFLISDYEPLCVLLDVRYMHDASHCVFLHSLQIVMVLVVLIQDLLGLERMPELEQMKQRSALSAMQLLVLPAC